MNGGLTARLMPTMCGAGRRLFIWVAVAHKALEYLLC